MSLHNNLGLLFISFQLLISLRLTRSYLLPDVSPFPQPKLSLGPISSPSPSPIPTTLLNNYVSYPPSNPPSQSITQNADSPSDDPFNKFSTIINPHQIDPKVKEICFSTDYPALCLATVLPLLKGQTNIDVPLVCEITINATTKLAEFALSMAKKISEKPGMPPDLVAILKDCKGSYDDAVYNFQSAQNAFAGRDIGTMNIMLSAVITNVGDCEDAFTGLGRYSLLSNYADKLINMTSNCLAIISLMH